MEREELGPNGGALWAMEEVEANFDWLESRLEDCGETQEFETVDSLANRHVEETIILDPPGQAELTTHHNAVPGLLHRLEKAGYRVSE